MTKTYPLNWIISEIGDSCTLVKDKIIPHGHENYIGLDGNTSLGSKDIFLVKYDSSGTKKWTKQFGTSSSDEGTGVTTDSSGNIYVTGKTSGNLDANTSSGGEDIFLVKFNSDGVKQ